MQILKRCANNFFVELGFRVKDLKARRYKNHIGRKGIEDKIGMTLQSLEMYGYIGNKTKSYQIQRGFLLLFIFLSYQVVSSSHMLSGRTI